MEKRKMVILGAGSAMFTQGLVVDLIENPINFNWEVGLVDVDEATLDSITKLVKKMVKAKNADIKVFASVDRCDLLPGADYVVATIGVGGRRAWEQDVFIPRKYGIFQPVGDTMMPGGISRAMRMVPVMVDITRDIERICPNAHFFNYSNPMAIICRAIDKSGYKTTGLCHSFNNIESYLAKFIGADRSKFKCYGVGTNHLTFMYDIRYMGKNAIPAILKKYSEIKSKGIDYSVCGALWFDKIDPLINTVDEPFAFDILERYGAFPVAGDRHISEFFTEFFQGGAYYGKKLGVDAFSFERCIEFGDKIYDDMFEQANAPGELPANYFDRVEGEHEQLMEIIDSIENDVQRVFSAILPNGRAVSNLPPYAAIEMMALANSRGLSQVLVNDFPDVLAAIINKYLAIIEITVDAALKGDRNLFIEAILMGGYISDRNSVEKMVDELIEIHKQYLPQF